MSPEKSRELRQYFEKPGIQYPANNACCNVNDQCNFFAGDFNFSKSPYAQDLFSIPPAFIFCSKNFFSMPCACLTTSLQWNGTIGT